MLQAGPIGPGGQAHCLWLAATSLCAHVSAMMTSERITPSSDPIPPQATVIVYDGAGATAVRDVPFKLGPVQAETQGGDGISQALLSNHANF